MLTFYSVSRIISLRANGINENGETEERKRYVLLFIFLYESTLAAFGSRINNESGFVYKTGYVRVCFRLLFQNFRVFSVGYIRQN